MEQADSIRTTTKARLPIVRIRFLPKADVAVHNQLPACNGMPYTGRSFKTDAVLPAFPSMPQNLDFGHSGVCRLAF